MVQRRDLRPVFWHGRRGGAEETVSSQSRSGVCVDVPMTGITNGCQVGQVLAGRRGRLRSGHLGSSMGCGSPAEATRGTGADTALSKAVGRTRDRGELNSRALVGLGCSTNEALIPSVP